VENWTTVPRHIHSVIFLPKLLESDNYSYSYPFYYFTVLFVSYCISFLSCYCCSVSDHPVLLLLINLIWFDLIWVIVGGWGVYFFWNTVHISLPTCAHEGLIVINHNSFCLTQIEWRSLHFSFFLSIQFVFYERQHICYSAYMPSQFRLSVCPSDTRVDQSKAFEVRIMQFSPYSSPIPLVSAG